MIDLLYALARDYITAAADSLAEGGLASPTRRLVEVSVSTAPVDVEGGCEDQLSVAIIPPSPATVPSIAQPPPNRGGGSPCALIWQVTLTLTLFRCHPPAVDALPSAKALDDSAKASLADIWQLSRGLGYRWSHRTLLPTLGPVQDCSALRFGPIVSPAPSGGIRAIGIPLVVLVTDQYDPANPTTT